MTDTLCVLALDAADYELIRQWDCPNLLLDKHAPIETFSWSKEEPYTPEVWATVATGVSPAIHGLNEERQEQEWNNPLLRLVSKATKHLPNGYRQRLGRPFRERGASSTFQTINSDVGHPFDHTLSWPGLGEASHLDQMWTLADNVTYGETAKHEITDELYQLTGQEFGYLEAMATTENALVGVHAHILDIAGHLYCDRPDELREWYEWVDGQVGRLREHCEQLVILSDHGMQTTYLDDSDPGSHSWRPYIAAQGIGDKLPPSVYDVREYLEANTDDGSRTSQTIEMDTPKQKLKDLGYIDED